ncbi:MAG: hypothetical protein ACKO5P_07645 [Nodosilinea sp.]
MLRPDSSNRQSQPESESIANDGGFLSSPPDIGDVDIQQDLNKLEELILASPRLPFTSKTLVDEDLLLDQLDAIRLNLPPAFRQAVDVLHQRRTLITDADRYAQDLIAAAEQQAAQILNETGILQKAEQMAQQLKAQTQADCEHLRSQVLADLEATKLQAQREWEILRQKALQEQDMIQQEADAYADRVLSQVEQQLAQMLRVIENGRSQLQPGQPSPLSRSSVPKKPLPARPPLASEARPIDSPRSP